VEKSEYIINIYTKTPKTLWEKRRKPQHKNIIIVPMKNPRGKKIKKHILSYIDIVLLKYIVRKLFKAKLTQGKEYNVMLSCQMTL
jgi:hypothetical protein